MKKSESIKDYSFCNAAIQIIALLVLFCITTAAFFIQSRVAMNRSEAVSFHWTRALPVVLVIILICLLVKYKETFALIDGKKLFIAAGIMYLIAGLVFVFGIGDDLRADASWVYEAAVALSEGDFSKLDVGEYLYIYPYQLGIVSYERLLLQISPSVTYLFFINLLWTLWINFMCCKLCQLLFPKNSFVLNLTTLLTFAFLPQLFFTAWAYGLIPGFAMCITAFYFQLCFLHKKKLRYFFLCMIAAILSYILRSNYLIGLLAMAAVFMLYGLREKKVPALLFMAAILAAAPIGSACVNGWYTYETGKEIPAGAPKTLWIAMGLRDESSRMGGWYDQYNHATYIETNYDNEKANQLALATIYDRLRTYGSDPLYGAAFFGKKAISTWCDPLFQSLWTGPMASSQSVELQPLKSLYRDGKINALVREACQVELLFVYAMALYALIYMRKHQIKTICMVGIIYFLGGFFFHLIWETKSQYVYPYFFMLIPYAAWGCNQLADHIKRQLK